MGDLAQRVWHPTSIPYSSLPHFPQTFASGHAGQLIQGFLAGLPVILMQGRSHRYEGFCNRELAFPIHVFRSLGVSVLITTNAAGGLNPRFQAGDLMVIDSHIDLLWSRRQPSPPDGEGAVRRNPAYDTHLMRRAHQVARLADTSLHQGTYLATLGPTYETRSEYRFFRWLGADAVGMSTLPEMHAASQLGLRLLAFSVITNVASTDIPTTTTHGEVVDAGIAAGPRLLHILQQVLEDLSGQPD
jgi:purine-nucleoside phosphorylase